MFLFVQISNVLVKYYFLMNLFLNSLYMEMIPFIGLFTREFEMIARFNPILSIFNSHDIALLLFLVMIHEIITFIASIHNE